ncbi:serine aminopeptidase domain-containing protein [Croceitalea sp. P059]|uniref:alpha/beta hydrolase n=1 Tax=Croceitalea sp. P059 TaxID=3075601 RepID=UPI002885141E|nr:alpha/beta hydrolase [Croceitalea sp. P059]MDT0540837.1 alpha/beta hydrolase [Croceitalea sp. P059]
MKKLTLLALFIFGSIFSQEVVSEEILLTNYEIKLPGTLSYLENNKPQPLVIFIHGSGNIDRNGNQGILSSTNYIKSFADSLNSKGIAFYRYDKRTSNADNLNLFNEISFNDLVEDAKINIDYFKKDRRFNSIHLIGHSQGSLVGMLIANENCKTYTSLAGPGTDIGTTLISQITAQQGDLGKATEMHITELLTTDTIQEVNPFLMAIFQPRNQQFLKEWILLDPIEEIKKLTLPTLIINGDEDSQVKIEDAKLLSASKPDAKLVIIKKMNHLLKTVEDSTENLQSYTDSTFPISTELVLTVTEFIKENE